ncbi:MAG: hypothetical protein KKB30_02820 [Proteobacteria bacterium]|nr:hypothetical protein [Pseudomonadota bacterium]MBU1716725.1 hypothetical protein [Pseudomonadota bacterium]
MKAGAIGLKGYFNDRQVLEMSDKLACLSFLREVIGKQVFNRELLTISAELCFPADFPAFDGHFPGQPVLPAVIQLVVVRMLAGDLLQMPLTTVKTGSMKFKGMIMPTERISIKVVLKKIDSHWQADFALSKLESDVASGNILFKKRQD